MTPAETIKLLLRCYRQGKVSPGGARRWAQADALGQMDFDVRSVETFAAGPNRPSAAQVSALASDLAAIYAGARVPLSRDEITDAEADTLFPPQTAEEAAQRERTVAAAAARLAELPDEDLYSLLWPGTSG